MPTNKPKQQFFEDDEDLRDEDGYEEPVSEVEPEPDANPEVEATKPAPKKAARKAPKKDATPDHMFIVDSAALRTERVHEMIVDGDIVSYTFQPGRPTAVPYAVGVRFLAVPSFYRTDENGSRQEWRPAPKQPDEYQPGENFKLADDEVVARYDELSTEALRMRAMMLPGGERFASAAPRQEMVDFIVERKKITRQHNSKPETRTMEGNVLDWTPDSSFFDDEVM